MRCSRCPAGRSRLYNTWWDWAGWLERALDEIVEAKAPRLIVDLRRNEGGLDCGDPILARCLGRPLPVLADERLVRYRRVADDLNPVLDTWNPSYRDWGDRAQAVAERPGFFRLAPSNASGDAGGRAIEPRGPRFTSALRVLTRAAPTARPPFPSPASCTSIAWAGRSVAPPAATCVASTAVRSSSSACRRPGSRWICRGSATTPGARCGPMPAWNPTWRGRDDRGHRRRARPGVGDVAQEALLRCFVTDPARLGHQRGVRPRERVA